MAEWSLRARARSAAARSHPAPGRGRMSVPFLELAIVLPLLGAVWIGRMRNFHAARQWCAVIAALTFACTLLTWRDAAAWGHTPVEPDGSWTTSWRLAGS